MQPTLFTMPIKPGKKDDYLAFIKECCNEKAKEYKDLLMRYGLNNVKLWTQTLGGQDYAMFTHEMDDDGMKKLESWPTSTHPFDEWFRSKLEECYDMDNLPEQPVFHAQFG